uniref:Uncharacterized protein n=1 Tax=Oryza meridionalis TaxID=40149 RepID=A0A0E0D5N3_9ORYZ
MGASGRIGPGTGDAHARKKKSATRPVTSSDSARGRGAGFGGAAAARTTAFGDGAGGKPVQRRGRRRPAAWPCRRQGLAAGAAGSGGAGDRPATMYVAEWGDVLLRHINTDFFSSYYSTLQWLMD